jgi:hypothetical protein
MAYHRAYRVSHREELRAYERERHAAHREERLALMRSRGVLYPRVSFGEERINTATLPPEYREVALAVRAARVAIRQHKRGELA